jgi:hypothetical protein
MNARRAIISVVAVTALSAAIPGPVLGAQPTYSGTLMASTASGEVVELNTLDGATRKVIAVWRKHWTGRNGSYEHGSFDTSGLTKDV